MSEPMVLSPAQSTQRVPERRASVRYHCNWGSFCSGGTYERVWAQVRDLSVEGIGLALDSPMEPGTLLTIEMPTKISGASLTVLARVVHATPQTEFLWIIGCAFVTRLTQERLQDLV